MSTATALSREGREAALTRMTEEQLDVLVIGGGVVGAGAALDAVTRGLRVGLVEARDLACGTSSRSTKLFHGGLRYLKQLHFHLVFEALRERRLMLERLCPHLGRPVRFVYPLQRRGFDRAYVGLGVGVYDVMGAGRGVPSRLEHLSRQAVEESFRSGRPGEIHGGVAFYEGQLDDARHTMMIARTAADHGAAVATSARVVDLVREGGAVVGAIVQDLESGRRLTVRAHRVVNATGVWTEEILDLLQAQHGLTVRASKGVHLLVPRSAIDSDTGLITETEKSLLFVVPCPWSEDHWIIGTTDTPWDGDLANPAASAADVDYILAHVNGLLATPLGREDVVGVYSGLRPLLARSSDANTAGLSREHAVVEAAPGLVVIAGGKYTTYRVMAADAIDAAVQGLPLQVPASRTAAVPLVGAQGYQVMAGRPQELAERHGLPVQRVEHLLGRYGSLVTEVLDLAADRPDLLEPIAGAPRYLRVEAHYAVSHEGALHLGDVMERRLRIRLDSPGRGQDAAFEVARIVAGPLGWDETVIDREVSLYLADLRAEQEAMTQPDDATADVVRRRAPDPRSRLTSCG